MNKAMSKGYLEPIDLIPSQKNDYLTKSKVC